MEKSKIVAAVTLMVVLMASVTILTPSVSAPAQNYIILPFHTSWENGQPLGRVNSVDSKKDFYGYNGPGDPLPPELGYRNSGDTGVSVPSDKDAWTESLTPTDGSWSGVSGTVSLDTATKVKGSGSIKTYAYLLYYAACMLTLNSGKEVNANLYSGLNFWIRRESTFYGNINVILFDTAEKGASHMFNIGAGEWFQRKFKVGTENADIWDVESGFDWTQIKWVRFDCWFSGTGTGSFWVDGLYFVQLSDVIVTPADGTFFGYNFGSRFLMAAGYFGASYSYAYFNLFDQTPDSDYGPPFKIRPQTFINIWYYHYQLANSMIDAKIYNVRTKQYWTLRDFNYDGKYIVDQNGVRIHPACRYVDPLGSWEFASFDLSMVYESDPENWYITKIWIGFDNGGNGQTGQCRTYFDMLFISYGLGGNNGGYVSGSIVAWDKHLNPDGKYSLWLKVAIAGHKHTSGLLDLYAETLEVSVDNPNAQALKWPEPTGVNLTQPDPQAPKVREFIFDTMKAIVSWFPGGVVVDVADLTYKFYGLIKSPDPQPTYTFPQANLDIAPELVAGEVYILISGITPGEITIPIKFKVMWWNWDTDEFTLNFTWSSACALSLPVCAMKTKTDGYFYVPNVATDLLKIEMLFSNSGLEGDQSGGTSPYTSITHWPNGNVDLDDVLFVSGKYGSTEGAAGWDYMADIAPDRKIDLTDYLTVCMNYGHVGSYPPLDLAGVEVVFDTGHVLVPDSYGFITIPISATSFTVYKNGTSIGAMVIFW